jgi:hypothetical protein
MSTKKKSAKAAAKRASTKKEKLDTLSAGLKIPLSSDAKAKLVSLSGPAMTRTAVNSAYVASALGHQSVTENDAVAAIAIQRANKKSAGKKK